MQSKGIERYPLAVRMTEEERREVDTFFEAHPNYKKGETFKKWILESLRSLTGTTPDQASELRKMMGGKA